MSSDNMTETEPVVPPPPLRTTPGRRRRRLLIGSLVALVILVPVLGGGFWLATHTSFRNIVAPHRATPAGPFPWSNATRTTAPSAQYAVFAQQNNPVDPAFQAYYTRVHGTTLLGNALTPAYPTNIGWTQLFTNGALVVPAASTQTRTGPSTETPPGDLDPSLLRSGQIDSATGIVRLPLLTMLLTAGSKISLGGDDSSVTYVTLREATAPSHLAHLQTPQPQQSPGQSIPTEKGVFIVQRASKGTATGHAIPQAIWNYVTDSDVATDGWKDTFGIPLTEALSTTATVSGASHHLLVQAFTLAIVVVDLDQDGDDGQPVASMAPLGRDYLETLGPPAATVPKPSDAWLTGNAAIVSTPGGTDASVHLGKNFPLTLRGQTEWVNGMLWYETDWKSIQRSGSGWTAASMVTMTAPDKGADAWASFDALSPDIAKYLAGFGTNVGSVVYDVTRNQYYTYNENTPFILASSSKVSIMVSYLSWLESQGRGPNDFENSEMINMIEHSDNNAAQLLFDRLGGGPGMAAFYQRIGIAGYVQNPYGWGWASLPPLGQAQLLTMLQQGKILTAQDRSYALNLMSHIESDQRMGVGETLPPGATVAMKDGWVPAPDGLWAINTSGIVTAGNETYIIVVYTAQQDDYDGAWNITRTVCKAVGQLLV